MFYFCLKNVAFLHVVFFTMAQELYNICVRLKRICHPVLICLTLCCSFTCRAPRAHHLPHSLFVLPRHQNSHYNRENTMSSKNTWYIITLFKNDQSKSNDIKNHSVVKPAEWRTPAQNILHRMWAQGACDVLKDLKYKRSISIIWCTKRIWRRTWSPSSDYRRSEGIWRNWHTRLTGLLKHWF